MQPASSLGSNPRDVLGERALNVARRELQNVGTPSWLAIAFVGDSAHPGQLVSASREPVLANARAMADAVPEADVLVAGCTAAGGHLRFVVEDLAGNRLLLRTELAGGEAMI